MESGRAAASLHFFRDVYGGRHALPEPGLETDWNTQMAIGGLLNGLRGLLSGLTGALTRGTATSTATIIFEQGAGHGARHLAGTGLSQGLVEGAIRQEIQGAIRNAAATGSFFGRISVGGRIIEYHAFTLPNGIINVGTYFIPRGF